LNNINNNNNYQLYPNQSSVLNLPLRIAGCTLWLDAEDATTMNTGIASNGSAINQWKDKSINQFLFTQSTTGNQPIYSTNTLNGKATIQFTAANSTYLGGPTNFEPGTNSFAVFAVFKWTDSTSTGWVFNKSLQGSYSGRILMGRNNSTITTGLTLSAADGLTTSFTDTYLANTYRILCFIYNRGSRTTTVYQNGTSIISQTYTETDVATSQTNTFNFIVGGYNNGTGSISPPANGLYLNGNIAEILNFTNSYDMTTTIQQQIEGYLAWKWGLQTTLPSNHPFYLTQLPNPDSLLTKASIFQKLVVVQFTGIPKVYDGTIGTQLSYTLSGIIPGDIVDISNNYYANFSDMYAGLGKTVTISNIVLVGSSYFNYYINPNNITYNNITRRILAPTFISIGKV
jgi:hypothetical protein